MSNLSNTEWLNTRAVSGRESLMNVQYALDYTWVRDLVELAMNPPVTTYILGDYTKWCSSLTFYPFDFGGLSAGTPATGIRYLDIAGTKTNVRCDIVKYKDGMYLGEYYVKDNNSFTDYEPYTLLDVYLPYFGFINIPIKEVIGKYIQFNLIVDFYTGQAQYLIGVNNNSVKVKKGYPENSPDRTHYDDSDTRIIMQKVFQLGVNIPLTQTGMAETMRNIVMSAVKGVVSVASSSAIVSS